MAGESTIRDVARRAGVSIASVSRVLNGVGHVSAATRQRILAAVSALQYVPHAGARSLNGARSQAIGVAMPVLYGEFFSEFMRGMDDEAGRRNYMLLLSNIRDGEQPNANPLHAMRGRVDGLVVMTPRIGGESLGDAVPANLPAVLVNMPPSKVIHPRLHYNNIKAVENVVRHLVEQGCRHIVHIAGAPVFIDAGIRERAYIDAVRRYLPGTEPRVLQGEFTRESGERAAAAILDDPRPVDAIFAANDMMALGCWHVLHQAGKSVPDEIAIAGFDDIPIAQYADLTTVRVDIAALGARAVARVIDLIEGKSTDTSAEEHPTELVIRGSTRRRAS